MGRTAIGVQQGTGNGQDEGDEKAVAYVRVSTAEQGRSGLGLEAQLAAIEAFAKAHGCELIATYREVETGNVDRNLPQRGCCSQGESAILVSKLDPWRNR